MDVVLRAAFAVCGIILLFSVRKMKLRFLLLSAVTGMAALVASDLLCGAVDMNMPINASPLCVRAVGGISGVVLLHLLNCMFL